MQLSKIKRMSEKRKRAWFEAINELVEDYKNDQRDFLDCPLCAVPKECSGCLWFIIEGCECSDYRWGNGYEGVPQRWDENYKEWIPHRLKMLDIWKKIITIYIFIDSMEKTFKDLGQNFIKIAEKLRPIGEAIKEINEVVEKQKKKNKKGGNHGK